MARIGSKLNLTRGGTISRARVRARFAQTDESKSQDRSHLAYGPRANCFIGCLGMPSAIHPLPFWLDACAQSRGRQMWFRRYHQLPRVAVMVTAVCAEVFLATKIPGFPPLLLLSVGESSTDCRLLTDIEGASAVEFTSGKRCEVRAFRYRLWAMWPRSARLRPLVFTGAR